MNKLDKKLRKIINIDELEINQYVPDEMISKIKQSILKAIMEKEFVNKEWISTKLTYVDKNFVYSKDIEELLGEKK